MVMTPAEFGKFVAADVDTWAKVIKFAGITPGWGLRRGPRPRPAPAPRRGEGWGEGAAVRARQGHLLHLSPCAAGQIAYGSLLGGGNARAACSTSPRVRGEVDLRAEPWRS